MVACLADLSLTPATLLDLLPMAVCAPTQLRLPLLPCLCPLSFLCLHSSVPWHHTACHTMCWGGGHFHLPPLARLLGIHNCSTSPQPHHLSNILSLRGPLKHFASMVYVHSLLLLFWLLCWFNLSSDPANNIVLHCVCGMQLSRCTCKCVCTPVEAPPGC